MKKLLTPVLLISLSFMAFGQPENPEYDAALSKKYGADDYGMKSYVLVILKSAAMTPQTRRSLKRVSGGTWTTYCVWKKKEN